MLVNKRYFFELCEYAEAPLIAAEKKVAGEATDETGRFIDPKVFLRKAAIRCMPVTKHQEEILDLLQRIEYIRRTNKRG